MMRKPERCKVSHIRSEGSGTAHWVAAHCRSYETKHWCCFVGSFTQELMRILDHNIHAEGGRRV